MNTASPSLLIKLYFLSSKGLQRLFLLLRAFQSGFWLGVLQRETLHTIDKVHYDSQKMYFDEGYNKSGLRKWEQNVIDNYYQKSRSVLIASVGGGREVVAMKNLGYQVDGFECHPELTAFANELLQNEGLVPNVKLAPRNQCPSNGHLYDGLIVGWAAYMLIQGREQRIEFLKSLHAQVRPQSPIMISFYVRAADSLHFRVIARVGNTIRRILRREHLELGDDLVPNFVHYFSENEIAAELLESGFELKFYSVKSYGHAVGLSCRKGEYL
jgi:hypothetical protein